MARINENYLKLPGSYLFAEIARRVAHFKEENPSADIIRLGIGDVTRPLVPAVIKGLEGAVAEMGQESTFRGYGPEQGYDFLIKTIIANDFTPRGVKIEEDEVFVSDGSKSDVGNIQEIFSTNAKIAITDPVYPVYLDTNVMAGRTGLLGEDGRFANMTYLVCNAENNFSPALPETPVDVIYLCVPNNPTGTTLSRTELKKWVDYARETEAVILFDAAYEAYIQEDDVPHSIYEIEGANEVAIEFRSFSKTAGFTGTRCAYTVVPKALVYKDSFGNDVHLRDLWARRVSTKFNGVSYITQRGAEAAYSPEGNAQIMDVVSDYMENARIIREGLQKAGYTVFGGINAPYIWLKVPHGDSWRFYDELLSRYHIIGTPGEGFGAAGEGYFRMTAFATRENTLEAMERIQKGSL